MQIPEPNEADCLSVLQSLIRIKSYSKTSGEVECTAHSAKLMREAGLDAELVKFDEGRRQNAVGVWRGSGGGKRLLFNGHLDTNPVTEGWTVDPWEGLVREGCIYGIGVSNMSELRCGLVLYGRAQRREKAQSWARSGGGKDREGKGRRRDGGAGDRCWR